MRYLFVLSSVAMAYTAFCWFDTMGGTPLINIDYLRINPIYPFTLSLLILLGGFVLYFKQERVKRDSPELLHFSKPWHSWALIGILLICFTSQLPEVIHYRAANDSDSAVMGLAGYHIADGKEQPMFMYHKHYIGTMTAHISATIHLVFGAHPAHLRIVHVLFICAFVFVIFLLASELFGVDVGLITAFLCSVIPASITSYFRYPEFPQLFLFASLYLFLIVRYLKYKRNRSSFTIYWAGVVAGLGFWAKPQFVPFIIIGFLLVVIVDYEVLLSTRLLAWIPGAFVGSIATFIDSWYHDWIIFRYFFGESSASFDRLGHGFSELWRHLATFFGAPSPIQHFSLAHKYIFIPQAITVLFAAGIVFSSLYLIYRIAKKPDIDNRLKLLPIISIFVIAFLFAASEYSSGESSFRNTIMLFVPLLLSVGFVIGLVAKYKKVLSVLLIIVLLGVNVSTHVFAADALARIEAEAAEFQAFCEENELEYFYSTYWLTYWTSFFTEEKVIVTDGLSGSWIRYKPYLYQIIAAEKKPSFLFLTEPNRKLTLIKQWLAYLNLDYKSKEMDFGTILYDLSTKLTPMTFDGLEFKKYRASIAIKQFDYDRTDGRMTAVVTVNNPGDTELNGYRARGFCEIQLSSVDQEILYQYPITEPVAPGEQKDFSATFLVSDDVINTLYVMVKVNGVLLDSVEVSLVESENELVDVVELQPLEGCYPLSGFGEHKPSKDINRVWSDGTETEVVFSISEKLQYKAYLNIPRTWDDGNVEMAVYLNAKLIGTEEISGPSILILDLPESALTPGRNVLTLSYSRVQPRLVLEGRNREQTYLSRGVLFKKIEIVEDAK